MGWIWLAQEGIHLPLPPAGGASDRECPAWDHRPAHGAGNIPRPPPPRTCTSMPWQGGTPSDHGEESMLTPCEGLCSSVLAAPGSGSSTGGGAPHPQLGCQGQRKLSSSCGISLWLHCFGSWRPPPGPSGRSEPAASPTAPPFTPSSLLPPLFFILTSYCEWPCLLACLFFLA